MSMTPSRRTIEAVTLADLAADNRLMVVRCNLCRKTENYLAADLAKVMGGAQKAFNAFEHCPHCGNPRWLRVDIRLPTYQDDGKLKIRRPVRRARWYWRDAIYRRAEIEPQ